jgi:hypothetical protein
MALPGFTATLSRYRSARVYRAGGGGPVAQAGRVVPSEFNCDEYPDGTVCTCDGLPNCIHMFSTGVCSQVAQCDASLGADHPVCGCIAN